MVSFEKITGVMGWRVLVIRLYSPAFPKIRHCENKWSNNLPMSSENGAHEAHEDSS